MKQAGNSSVDATVPLQHRRDDMLTIRNIGLPSPYNSQNYSLVVEEEQERQGEQTSTQQKGTVLSMTSLLQLEQEGQDEKVQQGCPFTTKSDSCFKSISSSAKKATMHFTSTQEKQQEGMTRHLFDTTADDVVTNNTRQTRHSLLLSSPSSSSCSTHSSWTLKQKRLSTIPSLPPTAPKTRAADKTGASSASFFLTCPMDTKHAYQEYKYHRHSQEYQHQEEMRTSESQSLFFKDICTSSSSAESKAAATDGATRSRFVPRPAGNLYLNSTRKRRAYDATGPLAAPPSSSPCQTDLFPSMGINSGGTAKNDNNLSDSICQGAFFLEGVPNDELVRKELPIQLTPRQSLLPSRPSNRPVLLTDCLHADRGSCNNSLLMSNPLCHLDFTAEPGDGTTITYNSTPNLSRPITSPIQPPSIPSSLSPFSICSPSSKDLSRFGNLTIQSPGSSFTPYSPPGVTKQQGKGGTTGRSNNQQYPASSFNMLPDLPQQNPRQVPIAVVSAEKVHQKDSAASRDVPISITKSTCNPFPSNVKHLESFPKEASSMSPHHQETNDSGSSLIHPGCHILMPDMSPCHPLSYGTVNMDSDRGHIQNRLMPTRRCDKAEAFPSSPPMPFLDLNQNQQKCDLQPQLQSLFKPLSTNSLDDFFFDDISSSSSLTDSGDEGEWFFLSRPNVLDLHKPITATMCKRSTEFSHHWKKPRPSFLHENQRHDSHLPFKIASNFAHNSGGWKDEELDFMSGCHHQSKTSVVTDRVSLDAKNSPQMKLLKHNSSTSSSLVGLQITNPKTKASFHEQSSEMTVIRHKKVSLSSSTSLSHQAYSSSKSLEFSLGYNSSASYNETGTMLQQKPTMVICNREDLVTPPVMIFHDATVPPTLKPRYLQSVASMSGM